MSKESEEISNIEYRISNEEGMDSRSFDFAQDKLRGNDKEGSGNDREGRGNDKNEPTVESVVEAVLFAGDEPLREARLADIVGTSVSQIRKHVKNLNDKYKANGNAFRIEQIAGGLQMLTLSSYNHWLSKLLRVRDAGKLSAAALETLAIIAYKQPIIRADVEAIRGVAVGEIIRNLMYKGLVKIVGRAEVLGRPMLYGTTKKFLEVFGLNSLKDLPKIEELKKPPS
jgi:segregation and condensation protein B